MMESDRKYRIFKYVVLLVTVICIMSYIMAYASYNAAYAEETVQSENIQHTNSSNAYVAAASDASAQNADQTYASKTKACTISIFRELSQGMTGDDVKVIQERLIELNYLNDVADGSFGPNTRSAVEKFQTANNLTVDGCVNAAVYTLLMSDNGNGISGDSGDGSNASNIDSGDSNAANSGTDTNNGSSTSSDGFKLIDLELNTQLHVYLSVDNFTYSAKNIQTLVSSMENLKSTYFQDTDYYYEIDYDTILRSSEINSTSGYVLDVHSTFVELLYSIINNQSTCCTYWHPVYYEKAYWGYYGPDNGYSTFIGISIESQHLWYFINGRLFLETPVVTGLPTEKRSTPTGEFYIINHATGIYLEGEMDGESWNNYVNFWMAITYDGVGLHDASWRGTDPSNYGGSIYTYNGSHGCINIPYAYAQSLFYNTYDGIPVIIY